jgi:hypothetical protein
MSQTRLSLSSEQFEDFIKFVTNFRDPIFNDIDIRAGLIRQRSNDKSCIIEVNLASMFPDISFALTDLKKKLDILKLFSNQNELSLTVVDAEGGENGYFLFSDSVSSFRFDAPTLSFVDNPYIPSDELSNIFSTSEEDLLLRTSFSTTISNRIRIVTQNYNVAAIKVTLDGEQANISAQTQSKDQYAKLMDGISTNIVLEKSFVNLPTIPFGFEHDTNIEFSMYKEPNDNIALNKFSTTLGALEITIYCRSRLLKET